MRPDQRLARDLFLALGWSLLLACIVWAVLFWLFSYPSGRTPGLNFFYLTHGGPWVAAVRVARWFFLVADVLLTVVAVSDFRLSMARFEKH